MSQGSVYERQVDAVLTGGWNLLPPGDLIATQEALECENFVVNSAGNLRSRLGHGSAIWSPGPVRNFCIVQGASVRRYAAGYDGHLYRGGTDLADFGGKIGMVSYQGFLWAMSNSVQKKDDGTSLLVWTPAAPSAPVCTPTSGGLESSIGKVYTYWVTYTTAANQESPSSDGTTIDPMVAPNTLITITSPTDPSDVQRTHYNVYRIGGTMEAALRCNVTPIALGTDFIDSFDPADGLSDLDLTNLGIELDPNAMGPPAGNGLAGPYYEHLLAWGVAAHPNRLYWSGTLQPYNFPGSSLDEGNHVDIGELGEGVVGVTIRPRTATIYKDCSIWRLVGDPDDLNSDLELVTREIGAISPPISVGAMDYFEGKEGLYSFNGEKPVKITGKLDPLFRGELPEVGFSPSPVAPLEQAIDVRALNALAHRNGRLYFFYSATGASTPNRGMLTELGADNWASDDRTITALLDEGTNGLLLGSAADDIVSVEEGADDDGSAFLCSYHSGYKHQGAPDQDKTYADVVIEHNTGGADVNVFAYYNNGQQSEALVTLNSSVRTIDTIQLNVSTTPPFSGDLLGWKARNMAIRLEGAAGSDPIYIYKIFAHYFVEPRDSKTYDSDETDLGTQKVKQVSELELDIDYPAAGGGTITWTVFAGLASAGLTSADTNTVASTTGREVIRIPLVAGIVGRLLRVTLNCATAGSTFKLYGVRLRVLPIGEFYDGAKSEFFTTQELGYGL